MSTVLQPRLDGLTRHTFEAMGVTVELLLDGFPAGAASALGEAELRSDGSNGSFRASTRTRSSRR